MAEIFHRQPAGYPRYRFAFDTERGEVVLQMESSIQGNVAKKIYLDEGLLKLLEEYASEAGLR